jgi:hypothetical protein
VALRALGILLVVLAGCTSSTPTPGVAGLPTRIPLPSGRIALPDHEPCVYFAPSGIPCVDTGHAIDGTVQQAGSCIWLTLDNGQDVRVVWPFGYSAIPDPVTIFDNRGDPVISTGDTIKTGGDGPTEGVADSCGRTSYVEINEPTITIP